MYETKIQRAKKQYVASMKALPLDTRVQPGHLQLVFELTHKMRNYSACINIFWLVKSARKHNLWSELRHKWPSTDPKHTRKQRDYPYVIHYTFNSRASIFHQPTLTQFWTLLLMRRTGINRSITRPGAELPLTPQFYQFIDRRTYSGSITRVVLAIKIRDLFLETGQWS